MAESARHGQARPARWSYHWRDLLIKVREHAGTVFIAALFGMARRRSVRRGGTELSVAAEVLGLT
ncbi:hypothetical protein Rhe02_18440 [Rhizocola hellebori]|uniref:Uncharacterized protein n=1 Tax=Rhizocola hellebori TaxID=1392758 RepID=A0A8J3VF45_9ACTN|nr:hypothetical protein Rhe02_18440 [Rhizocola hellebori]